MSSDAHPFSLLPPQGRNYYDNEEAPISTECIIISACVYTFLIVLLFTWPRYVVKHWTSDDGLGLIAVGMEIVLFTGGPAILLSLGMLCVAIVRWRFLSRTVRIIALYPILSSVVVMAVLAILSRIEDSKHSEHGLVAPVCPTTTTTTTDDGEECPTTTPKDITISMVRNLHQ